MGRKKLEPQKKTLSLVEKEIESATQEVKLAIMRLVQAKAVWERITGYKTTEKSCDCVLKAIDDARKQPKLLEG